MTVASDHDIHLAQAADHLRAAITGDKPLLAVAQGLRSLMTVLAHGHSIEPQTVGALSQLLFAVAPRIADAAMGRMTPEHVFTGLGCANAALTCFGAPRRFDLIVYVAVLEAELRALHLRDMIMAGDQPDLVISLYRNAVIAPPFRVGPPTVH